MQSTDPNSRFAGIDAGGADFDEHLAITGYRHVYIGHIQHIASAIAIETDRARFRNCHRCGYATTLIGSPICTVLKYHSALSGLRLMQPWLTLAYPCESTDQGAECT